MARGRGQEKDGAYSLSVIRDAQHATLSLTVQLMRTACMSMFGREPCLLSHTVFMDTRTWNETRKLVQAFNLRLQAPCASYSRFNNILPRVWLELGSDGLKVLPCRR